MGGGGGGGARNKILDLSFFTVLRINLLGCPPFLSLSLSSLCVADRGFAHIITKGDGGGANSDDSKQLFYDPPPVF
jgi:hypothetical protein